MRLFFFTAFIALAGCDNSSHIKAPDSEPRHLQFGQPTRVTVSGYGGDIMEPFLSRDGATLYFNNLNNPAVNTNLHVASRVNDSTFQYGGELRGVNTEALEGVPSADSAGVLFFVSTRSYFQTFSTIYRGRIANDSVSHVELVSGISRQQAGWVNFDIEASKDGNSLYVVDGRFDQNGGPYEADIVLAEKRNGEFQRSGNQSLLANINTAALEYAACISSDMRELYFTRVEPPLTLSSIPQVYVATRNSTSEPFGRPYKIDAITGFVEAPTISPDGEIIYYHKKDGAAYALYMVRKQR